MSNYGKLFENIVKAALESSGACFDRLPDQMSGYAGSTNPADFTAYKYPNYFYIECKSCQDERFDIKGRISEGQWYALLVKSHYEGVYAGYLIWFVNQNKIFWISAPQLAILYNSGKKVIVWEDLVDRGIEIHFQVKGKYPELYKLLFTISNNS